MDPHGYVEAVVFLLGCCVVGCVGGLVVTGIRIGLEVWRG